MNAIRLFLQSAAGRIFLLLMLGVLLAAFAAFAAAEAGQRDSLRRLRSDWTAQRIVDAVGLFDASSPTQRQTLLDTGLVGLRRAPQGVTSELDADLDARVARLTPEGYSIDVRALAPLYCEPAGAGPEPGAPLASGCWVVRATMSDGYVLEAVHAAPPLPSFYDRLLNPIYLTVMIAAAALLALLVAVQAASPLNRLARAAKDLGETLDRPPLPLEGPTEVRAASAAFNSMQARLRQTLGERTRMLGSITHDLQTPLTRMRLRVEKIADEDMRDRLISDLGAMQLLIREGLDLARSAEAAEVWSILDLRALLETLVDDAVEAGHDVSLDLACEIDLRARPQALKRCLQNLIDNAIAYGGRAAILCRVESRRVTIAIRDNGPGIPEAEVERVFEPFHRLEDSRSRETGGSGLGLTIAKALAQKNDATLQLRNLPEGGLEARLEFSQASLVREGARMAP